MAKREEDYSVSRFRQERTQRLADAMSGFERDQAVNNDVATLNTPAMFSKTMEHDSTTLLPNEADVVKLYFGLGEHQPMTLEEIGETFDLTRERVRQIKEKAIRRLKHTSRSKILMTYLG